MKTDVIIVGAGPTGLALACQFIRYGIDFVIFDQKGNDHAAFKSHRRSGANAGNLRANRFGG